jgi:hypothetical protein
MLAINLDTLLSRRRPANFDEDAPIAVLVPGQELGRVPVGTREEREGRRRCYPPVRVNRKGWSQPSLAQECEDFSKLLRADLFPLSPRQRLRHLGHLLAPLAQHAS